VGFIVNKRVITMPRRRANATETQKAAENAVAQRAYVPLEDKVSGARAAGRLEEDDFREPSESEPEATSSGSRARSTTVSAEATSEKPSMHVVFGPGGLLERSMIGGDEHRPAQLKMAELVHEAFEKHHHAIVEAGTGTGKTLAYLLPAICSGRRVVISTATKSLQEQLFQKDIPFLQKHFAPELKVAVMKGRSNFLCKVKAQQMVDTPMLKGMDEMDALRQIGDWAKLTETGDRAELTFLHDDSDLWARLDARRDTCTGQK